MQLLARILAYLMTFLTGMALVVFLQAEMVFPLPISVDGFVHPLYSFRSWVYVLAVLLFAAIAVAFSMLSRKIRRMADWQ